MVITGNFTTEGLRMTKEYFIERLKEAAEEGERNE